MSFLVVLCEGYAEMDFVQYVLVEHLSSFRIHCHPILFGKKVKHDTAESPGGIFSYNPVRKHINAALRQYSSQTSFVTTMMDFYAFPKDFPNYSELAAEPFAATRVELFERAMFDHMGRDPRFIPYIQLHEFEALIYTDLNKLRDEFSDDQNALNGLDNLIVDVAGLHPEDINQTKDGAPSKRLLASAPYDKRSGHRIVKQIGLSRLKTTCPHFGLWMAHLESLGS